ncbi:hypothetical protein FRACYDRAFT_250545 [Fragilariopsis cylindrus CCMP1102]|uniref:Plastid lipid-associated protein/fibrillin conserved domain-containing protein n=1 Tax=Fragilariopsis cylindrus CCMP1102 TaxID=635003 RepID=A0A1E7EPK5_9STRA|nr:hypothetical protein FRACYDRAFT_250545 [Fragilariopsis cylindrus CCMP1102]|eukprot:OEU07920.1 hypothetical protein FRACYDRAFT_250545 [Fragilariopsis cylindrus CCMP1102]
MTLMNESIIPLTNVRHSGFGKPHLQISRSSQKQQQRRYSTIVNNDSEENDSTTTTATAATKKTIESLKRELINLGASYDRGYRATSQQMNPEQNAIRGIDDNSGGDDTLSSPLAGNWRMIWTTAADVLTLNANPFTTVGAIYQVFDPPSVTNIIDLLPPFQTLLGSERGSLLRAKVQTRAYEPTTKKEGNNKNKIGLAFESISLEPVELFGNDVGFLPPLGFDLPRTPFEGFFDVTFLDENLLIIQQNAQGGLGGLFVLTKVDNFDP